MSKKNRDKTQDNSPHVHQAPKLKNELTIRELNWTEKQKQFINLALNKDVKVLIVTGPAGSSKTILAVFCALKLLEDKRVASIEYLRSPIESSEAHLGFLPGSMSEK